MGHPEQKLIQDRGQTEATGPRKTPSQQRVLTARLTEPTAHPNRRLCMHLLGRRSRSILIPALQRRGLLFVLSPLTSREPFRASLACGKLKEPDGHRSSKSYQPFNSTTISPRPCRLAVRAWSPNPRKYLSRGDGALLTTVLMQGAARHFTL
jgi:hypothetical protein